MEKLADALRPNDAREVVRVVGGILIGIGMLLVAFRYLGRASFLEKEPNKFVTFLIFALPAVFLYGVGILGRALGSSDRRWQALYDVFGALLLPLALSTLVNLIDETPDETLMAMLIFAACSAACVFSWMFANVRFQLLLGSVYAAIAWFAFLDKVLSDGLDNREFTTIRALLLVFAGILVVAAFVVRRRGGPEPEEAFGELLVGAGITTLFAFILGPAEATSAIFETGTDSRQEMVWDVLNLIVATGLVVFGIGRGLRGPVYVGALLFTVFLFSVGLDLDDETPLDLGEEDASSQVLGWPLLVCILGAAAFIWSLIPGKFPPALGLGGMFQGGREPTPEDPEAPTAVAPMTSESPAPPPATQEQPPPPGQDPPPPPPPPR